MDNISLAHYLMAGQTRTPGHTESHGEHINATKSGPVLVLYPGHLAARQQCWPLSHDAHVALLLRCTHAKNKRSYFSHQRRRLFFSFINPVLDFRCWHLTLSSFLPDREEIWCWEMEGIRRSNRETVSGCSLTHVNTDLATAYLWDACSKPITKP